MFVNGGYILLMMDPSRNLNFIGLTPTTTIIWIGDVQCLPTFNC